MQAANATPGTMHPDDVMEVLSLFPEEKCRVIKGDSESSIGIPELKIVKSSDTHWLAHERCVKAVKASNSSIVLALDNI